MRLSYDAALVLADALRAEALAADRKLLPLPLGCRGVHQPPLVYRVAQPAALAVAAACSSSGSSSRQQ